MNQSAPIILSPTSREYYLDNSMRFGFGAKIWGVGLVLWKV